MNRAIVRMSILFPILHSQLSISYCLSNYTKVDLSGGFGISDAAPKSYVAIGISFRIKPKKK